MKNPITNTLFRFVNFRSAQLATAKEQSTLLVNQPATLAVGAFYDAVKNRPSNTTKMSALLKAAETFKDDFADTKSIEDLSKTMYDFSVWVAQNRNDYSPTELKAEVAKVSSSLTEAQKAKVWNNFFYQVITQKSFYVKEALLQMLVADHVFTLFDKAAEGYSEHNDSLVNAEVALPVELFDDSDTVADEVPVDEGFKPFIPNKYYKSQVALTAGRIEIKNYDSLKNELILLEKKYINDYREAYDAAYKTYEAQNEPILKKYAEDVAASLRNFCSSGVTGPYDPKDPCQQPPDVPYPSLEPFVFTYEPQVTQARMHADLTYDSYNTLLGLLGYDFVTGQPSVVDVFSGYTTFDELYQLLTNAVTESSRKIAGNTKFAKKNVNVNGAIVPVAVAGSLQPFQFNLFSFRINLSSVFSLAIGVPDSSWQILNIRSIINFPDSSVKTIDVPNPQTTSFENVLQLNGFYKYTFPTGDLSVVPTIDFEVQFSNGSTKVIQDVPALMAYSVTGIAKDSITSLTSLALTPIKRPFIPTGFGFRNIGVADYLKLEQTVQCYVEGEVSHIENIMAREYKERATRLLRRSEETNTESTETEKEKLSDTTTSDRFEMNSEVAQVVAESKDMGGFVNAGFSGSGYSINSGVSFANNVSKENSIRQATTTSQEITNRALDRVVSKVKKERISKVLEEFEENNKHGFDNRQGSSHVTGVYRWVDKLYKNQIYNYGKRMMLEFMVPEPSKLHVLGMTESDSGGDGNATLVPPLDPRTYEDMEYRIYSPYSINDANLSFWLNMYNIEVEPRPLDFIWVGKGFAYGQDMAPNIKGDTSAVGLKGDIEIPEGYQSSYFHVVGSGKEYGTGTISVAIGGSRYHVAHNVDKFYQMESGFTGSMPVSVATDRYYSFQLNVAVKCNLTMEARKAWKEKVFKALIDAYEEALAVYNEKLKNLQVGTEEIKRTNPGFFRQIENSVLRKNCISYLLDRTPTAQYTYGKNMSNNVDSFEGYEVDLSPSKDLSSYASFVQFMEQAFEWDIMSYNFYPYYWGRRSNWQSLYTYDGTDDPIFRSFMQSGMARVIVTVRPGFEDAAALYLSTGLIWNGGRQPQLSDPLYVSLVAEVKKPVSEKYGKAWITRVPTSLTILQADSIGLKVEKALPCDCGNASEFEEGTVIPCNSDFEITDAQLNGDTKTLIRFTFQEIDHNYIVEENTIGHYDARGLFPRIYEVAGHTITIHRDAAWRTEDSSKVIFEQLAQQMSLINGIEAHQVNSVFNNIPDGVVFTIDTSIHADFAFKKIAPNGHWNPDFDLLRVITSNGNVRVIYNNEYVSKRILDKSGIPVLDEEQNTLLPLSRFKYEQ